MMDRLNRLLQLAFLLAMGAAALAIFAWAAWEAPN